jgi:hypothetical protein
MDYILCEFESEVDMIRAEGVRKQWQDYIDEYILCYSGDYTYPTVEDATLETLADLDKNRAADVKSLWQDLTSSLDVIIIRQVLYTPPLSHPRSVP